MITSKDIFMDERAYEMNQLDSQNDYASYYPEISREPITDDLPYEDQAFHIVKSITPSKANVSMLAAQISQQVSDGKVNAIDAAISLNATKKMCEEALELIRQDVVDELDKNKGKASKHECKVERAEVGVKYDYSANKEWLAFKKTEQEATAELKKIEERLKVIPAGKILVDEETGEVLTGPSKTSTTSFKVTLAK